MQTVAMNIAEELVIQALSWVSMTVVSAIDLYHLAPSVVALTFAALNERY